MNERSIYQNYSKKQQSSWIDDPFELGTHALKGMKSMSHQGNLDDYIQELVSSYADYKGDHYELVLENLLSSCQLELARLYIESIDRDIEWACYGDNQTLNSDFLCAMLSMLKDSTPETRTNFAQVTTRNILVYYKDKFQDLLDKGCELYFNNAMNEASYYADCTRDPVDIIWSKY